MRTVKDYYYFKAKKEKYPARSVFKLDEAQKKYKFLKPGQRVLDLGCYPGSWSLYSAGIVGKKGKVIGIDLQPMNIVSQKDHAEISCLCYDVYSNELIDQLKGLLPGFHVILSDMAPPTTGNRFTDHQHSLRLVRRAIEIAQLMLHENGCVYIKLFQGEDSPELIRSCNNLFQTLKIFKPDSSRNESREVFLLGRGFKKK